MSVIGSLAVNLTANTEKFSRGMKGARGHLREFEAGISKAKGLITGFAASLAAGFAINSLRETVNQIDELRENAVRLGIATDKLQGLERFGELAGASSEAVVTGLGKMEVSINKGVDSFKELGLSAAELKNMRPEEAFLRIGDAIRKIGNPNERMAAMRDIFGKGGASLLPTIMEGDARAGMEQYGNVSKEQAEAMDAVNDASKALGFAFTDLKVNLLSTVVPGLTKMIEAISPILQGKVPLSAGAVSARAAQRKYVEGMADDKFLDWTKANPLETLNPYQRQVAMDRINRMADMPLAAQHKLGITTPEEEWKLSGQSAWDRAGILGGKKSPFQMTPKRDMGGMLAWGVPQTLGGIEDPAEIVRISNAVDEAIAMSKVPQTAARRKIDMDVRGNGALEEGTAAAFSQGKRSQQASQLLDVNRQQLKAAQRMDKSLQNIDKNLKATNQPIPIVNLA